MDRAVNQEAVNDTAKLMMHRLIARALSRDAGLVERAKIANARLAERFHDHTFVRQWNMLLALPPRKVRSLLTSRSRQMDCLRLSSPFVLAEGVDFTDQALRRRIWAAAKRIAARGFTRGRGDNGRSALL